MAEDKIWEHKDEAEQAGSSTGAPVGTIEVERIAVANIVGPLVILYGPPEAGKTVTLLRLCSYLAPGYSVEVEPSFRSDDRYAPAVVEFERQRREEVLAPQTTGAINFLLVNVTLRGAAYCQILEAPGEHFFPKDGVSEIQHP